MAGFLDRLFSGGKEDELKKLQEKLKNETENVHLRVKVGDLLLKMDRREEAIDAYHHAALEYSRSGRLIQAIAMDKLILRLDPTRPKIHEELAELYLKRGIVAKEGIEKGIPEDKGKEPPDLPPIPLFSDLPKGELSRVMEKIRAKEFAKGMIICHEGDPGDSIFIISRGKVGIFRFTPQGKRIPLAQLSQGDFFGEFGFFSGAGRQATVLALEDAGLLEITRKDLEEITREFPRVSQILFNFYKERVLDNLLASSPLFQAFPPKDREQMRGRFTEEAFSRGDLIIKEGGPGDSFYIIQKGEVEVFTYDPQGELLPLGRLKEGDFFGEIALLTGETRTASVKALGAVSLVRLAKADFEQVMSRHPEAQLLLEKASHLRRQNKLTALGILQSNPAKEAMV